MITYRCKQKTNLNKPSWWNILSLNSIFVDDRVHFLLWDYWCACVVKIARIDGKLSHQGWYPSDNENHKLITQFFIMDIAVLHWTHTLAILKAYRWHTGRQCSPWKNQCYHTFSSWVTTKIPLFDSNNSKLFNVIFNRLVENAHRSLLLVGTWK